MRAPGVRGFWYTLGDLALLALAAYLASQAALRMAVPALAPPGEERAPGRPAAPGPRQEERTGSPPGGEGVAEAVVARNLFGSRGDAVPPSGAGESPAAAAPLPVQLLGTVVDSGGGRSFVILDDTEARKQVILFVGDSLRPGAVLRSVSRNRAVFLRDGREEVVERVRDPGRSASSPVPPRTAVPVNIPITDNLPREGDLPVNVRQTGPSTWVVDRRDLEGALGNLSQIAAQVRLIPNFAEGKPDGFRVFNIRPNSIFGKLGLANGDVVRRINGLELTGPEQALQAFTQLREASNISLDLSRANKNLTLQFEIR